MVGQPGQGNEGMAEHVAAEAAVGFLAVELHDAAGALEIAPGLGEIAEHDAGVPGVVGDQRQRFQHLVVGIAVVDHFDAGANAVDGQRDLVERERRRARRQVAADADADFELQAHAPVIAGVQHHAALHHAAGEHHARQRPVDVAHLLHARGGEADLVARGCTGLGDHQVDIAALDGVSGVQVRDAGFRRQEMVLHAICMFAHELSGDFVK